MKRSLLAAALLVTSVFGVTGCGSDDDVQVETRVKDATPGSDASDSETNSATTTTIPPAHTTAPEGDGVEVNESAESEALTEADCNLLFALNNANLVNFYENSDEDFGLDDLAFLTQYANLLKNFISFGSDSNDLRTLIEFLNYLEDSYYMSFEEEDLKGTAVFAFLSEDLERVAGDNLSDLDDLLINVVGSESNDLGALLDLVTSIERLLYLRSIPSHGDTGLLENFWRDEYRREILGECTAAWDSGADAPEGDDVDES